MKITAWRITQKRYAEKAFSGLGAWLEGARWNPRGVYMVYTAESISLAALEMLVHLPGEALLHHLYVRIPVEFDSALVECLRPSDLPARWNSNPPAEATQKIGADWVRALQSPVLKVPSSVIPEEHNYLLNPLHPDFGALQIGAVDSFSFDKRMVRAV